MKWLIVEDALKDRWGHFLEYDTNFFVATQALGDEVVLLCDRNAEDYVVSALDAQPVLPRSIWHRMSDRAGLLRRYLRLPVHAVATFFAMRRYFATHPMNPPAPGGDPVLIFVPTVLVHHLLGWYLLLKFGNCPPDARILLFFPNLPLEMDGSDNARWNGSPTTKLMAWLFQQLRPFVEQRRVVLGAETEAMRQSLAQLIGMPVIYLPHPIEPPPPDGTDHRRAEGDPLLFACYGTARAEKGSDVLQSAIERIVLDEGGHAVGLPPLRFAIQWIEDFVTDDGRKVGVSEQLSNSGKVDYIRRYFVGDEYEQRLRQTDAMVLPYLASSYNVRVSRIVIEAMVHGIPVIASEGTTVWRQARDFGAGLSFKEGDTAALADAMRHLALHFEKYSREAKQAVERARAHFSVSTFRRLFLNHTTADCLVIGDSHVARWDWAALDDRIWSYGVSGMTSNGLLEILARAAIPQPRAVVIWIGSNDVLQDIDTATVLENLRKILGFFPEALAAKQAGIVELPPPGATVPDRDASDRRIRELNLKLGEFAREQGIQWIDCADQITSPDGPLDNDFTPDGYHLSIDGYEKVSKSLIQNCAWLRSHWTGPAPDSSPAAMATSPRPILKTT